MSDLTQKYGLAMFGALVMLAFIMVVYL